MKYVRHYVQKTIQSESSSEFDSEINDIYKKAALSGKEPEIHFFEGLGFCASIKYYVSMNIPETISEEYELKGEGSSCSDCPYLTEPQDKRFKYSLCERTNKKTCPDNSACDIFYKEFREAHHGTN